MKWLKDNYKDIVSESSESIIKAKSVLEDLKPAIESNDNGTIYAFIFARNYD